MLQYNYTRSEYKGTDLGTDKNDHDGKVLGIARESRTFMASVAAAGGYIGQRAHMCCLNETVYNHAVCCNSR